MFALGLVCNSRNMCRTNLSNLPEPDDGANIHAKLVISDAGAFSWHEADVRRLRIGSAHRRIAALERVVRIGEVAYDFAA
jgi:hypothetical protein